MLIESVKRCILRDLGGLAAELDAYPDEASVWALPPGFKNSTGTLVLHCCGNLRHFIGATLGKSGYVRDRDSEFAARNVSRAELEKLLAVTRAEVAAALDGLDDAELMRRPGMTFGTALLPPDVAITHLAVHLGYHLGQADGHRRAVTGDSRAAGVLGTNSIADPPAR